MSEGRDLLFFAIGGIKASVLIFVALAVIVLLGEDRSTACAARWEPRQTQYDRLSGCRVEINGEFWPEDNVRGGE